MSYKKTTKCFSLIKGDQITLAPGSKILAADQLATLLDGEQMLKAIHEDAKHYRGQVAAECEQLKEHAAQEGFDEGFVKWAEAIAGLEAEIKQVEKSYTELLIPVALAAAKKIVGKELEQREDTIVDIVSQVLKAVAQHKRITIWTNPGHIEQLEKHREQLKALFEALQVLSIRPKEDIEEGGCIIETEGGIINARLNHQWDLLERAFEKMKPTLLKSDQVGETAEEIAEESSEEPSEGSAIES